MSLQQLSTIPLAGPEKNRAHARPRLSGWRWRHVSKLQAACKPRPGALRVATEQDTDWLNVYPGQYSPVPHGVRGIGFCVECMCSGLAR